MASEPLPTAADRSAQTNRLALLAKSQSSLLKSMNLNPSPSSTSHRRTRKSHLQGGESEEDDDGEESGGIGYVRPAAKDKSSGGRENDTLGRRLLGKQRTGMGDRAAGGKKDESSEDEEGRGSLGKRKRPRKAREGSDEAEVHAEPSQHEDEEAGDAGVAGENKAEHVHPSEGQATAGEPGSRKKKKKKKRKVAA